MTEWKQATGESEAAFIFRMGREMERMRQLLLDVQADIEEAALDFPDTGESLRRISGNIEKALEEA